MTEADASSGSKPCVVCGQLKPLSEFQRRTGRRAGRESRRGTCKSCMKQKRTLGIAAEPALAPAPVRHRPARQRSAEPVRRVAERVAVSSRISDPSDANALVATRQGFIRMRGRTDKGRRWYQEIDLELAQTLVRERAAVVVNRYTIRRLFSNKDFRRHILVRDKHTCYYCGQYGDTIDHLLPRAKGGHTTPDNCVCACMACNQSKADRDLEEFVEAEWPAGRSGR